MGGIHFIVTEKGSPLSIHQLQTEGGEWCIAVNEQVASAAKYPFAAAAVVYSLGSAPWVLTATALAGLFVPQLGQQIKELFDKIFEMQGHEHDGEPCHQEKMLQLVVMTAVGIALPWAGAACVGHWLSEQARLGIGSVSNVIDDRVKAIEYEASPNSSSINEVD